MRTVLCLTRGNAPTAMGRDVANAELVVLMHLDGTWSVWKDRHGHPIKRVPWDDLPAHVKREVPLHRKDKA